MGAAEHYVEGYLHDQCTRYGFMCLKFVSGENGVPDRCILSPAMQVFVETKSRTGTTRAQQDRVHARMRALGTDVRVISTREQVDALIQEMARAAVALRKRQEEER